MVAGRFKWKEAGAPITKRLGLAAFDFDSGTLLLTEASTKKRASIHLLRQKGPGLAALDPGGMEVLGSTVAAFAARLRSENHTLKRALTDPHLFSGIGNAYSDEILHHARMSPVKLTSRLTDEEIARLHASIAIVLTEWTDRLRAESGAFPEKGHRVPAGDGGARQIRQALPALRDAGCSAFATPRTNRTTVLPARPRASSSPTARSRA